MNGVQTRFKCKLDVKRCKRFVFPPSSLLPRSNALKTKAIRYFQTDRTLTRIVSPPLDELEIYHIALLRQVLENIASFLGTGQLKYVLDQIGITNADRVSIIVNALTHQKVYYPQMEAMVDDNKQIVREIYHALMAKYQFIIHPNK